MKNEMKISSIIIARDEENNIGRCLDSLKGCADEILVIIDSRTTDRTAEIVKERGARYEICQWQGYARTKEYAVSVASFDWILWIDADEALTEELKRELNSFKESSPVFSAYSIPRKANFLGRWIMHSGWYPGRVTRLFNRNKACFSTKDVHEHLVVEGSTGELINDLEHYTDPSIEHYFNKFNNYTTLAAEELYRQNKNASVKDIILRPAFIFVKMYFLKRGFLDGLHGFILAIFSSVYVFTKYCKLWELNRNFKQVKS